MRISFSTLAFTITFVFSSGCFKTTLEYAGGTNSGKPAHFKARFRLLGCMDDAKKLVLLPNSTTDYYLTDTAFYEISGDEGVKVTNQWKDHLGQYFFVHEKNLNKNGYLYMIPNDRHGLYLHLRFRGGSYQINRVEGSLRPFGGSPQVCILKKID